MRSIRLLLPAHLAASATLAVIAACGDDAVAPAPSADASSDAAPPVTTDDAGPDAPSITPSDWTKITWERLPTLPSDGVRAGVDCNVAVDGNDHVLVTYGESAESYATPRSLSVFRHDGTTWSTLGGTSLVADSGSYTTSPRLAVAKDGSVYVAYTHEGPHVRRFAGGAWTTLPTPAFGSLWGILVDPAGMPAVIGMNGGGEPRMVSRFDGVAWSAPTVPPIDADASGGGRGVLAFAPRPDGSIAALVRTTMTKLGAFTLSGTTWSPLGPELAEAVDFPALSSSAAGHLAAAWSGADNVFAARFDPATQTFVPLGGALGQQFARYAVTAIDELDRPFVAWREAGGIKVSVFDGGAWQSLPDPSLGPGTVPAITLDRHGLPVLCWESLREGGLSSEVFVARAVVK